MKRQIIRIDEEACNGCGLCVSACHEGAIAMVDGKARLIRDDYCDGLGNCLPACPTGAITFEEKDTLAYDEAAVEKHLASMGRSLHKEEDKAPLKPISAERIAAGLGRGAVHSPAAGSGCACPGSAARAISRPTMQPENNGAGTSAGAAGAAQSELRQWPVQIQLVPVNAPYFNGAHLLVAADCAAYAYANFHQDFIRNRITIIGCPKLDSVEYTEKLTAILAENDIKSLTVVRMEVPCCGGLAHAATEALKASGKFIPWQIVKISTTGERLEG